MRKLLIVGILFIGFNTIFSQQETKVPFSLAVSAHIVKYNQKIDEAYRENDLERAGFLFDSLVNNHLNGTYMDNFNVNPLKGDPISLEDYEKPIFLITYASWCVPGIGEIPALNDLADRFHDQIDFVVLFWDTKENLKEKSDEYSDNIKLVYVDEKTNLDSHIVGKLKHALGFPMLYFMDNEKKVLNIQKVETHHSSETLSNSYSIHFNSLSKGVSLIIADLDAKGLLSENTEDPEEILEEQQEKKRKKKKRGEDGRTEEERRIDEEYEKYKREKDSLNQLRDNNRY